MATQTIFPEIVNQDSGVSLDLVGNQFTAAASPSVGSQTCYVVADGGSDIGIYYRFIVPPNYVGSPELIISGILDGTPSAGDDLGFANRKRAVADNESADGTFDAEQTAQNTDISGWADKDRYVESISLTAGDYAPGDEVYGYVYLDASGTTYAGNFLWTSIAFNYSDA